MMHTDVTLRGMEIIMGIFSSMIREAAVQLLQ